MSASFNYTASDMHMACLCIKAYLLQPADQCLLVCDSLLEGRQRGRVDLLVNQQLALQSAQPGRALCETRYAMTPTQACNRTPAAGSC